MPNIAQVLKEEIMRLARKELRGETEKLKKALGAHRSEMVAMKRRVADLEKQVSGLGRVTAKGRSAEAKSEGQAGEETAARRFSAKGLAKQRERLGLSAQAFGMLLGVSAQTIYNWEAEKSKPRKSQLAVISAVRSMGKREARKVLEGKHEATDPAAAD
jgi:DNA-binding transcriptional regulator YiaG